MLMGERAAVAEHISKYYGSIRALDGVSLELRRGEIVGLLGPNGSGKTTLIKPFMGFMKPDAGHVSVLGADPYEDPSVRARVGYVPEELALYESLTPKEFFDLLARIRRMNPVATWRSSICWPHPSASRTGCTTS